MIYLLNRQLKAEVRLPKQSPTVVNFIGFSYLFRLNLFKKTHKYVLRFSENVKTIIFGTYVG